MKVNRMRIRFEDPRISPDQAQAIARRVSELVTGERTTDPFEPGLTREVAGRVSAALHGAIRSGGPSGPLVNRTRSVGPSGPLVNRIRSGGPSGPPVRE